MPKNLISLIIILFYHICLANEEGVIINVVDGDTVHLLNDKQENIKVRFIILMRQSLINLIARNLNLFLNN